MSTVDPDSLVLIAEDEFFIGEASSGLRDPPVLVTDDWDNVNESRTLLSLFIYSRLIELETEESGNSVVRAVFRFETDSLPIDLDTESRK